jgi:hypothetical protein
MHQPTRPRPIKARFYNATLKFFFLIAQMFQLIFFTEHEQEEKGIYN